MTKNNAIKSYKLANGEIRYKFQVYIGVDPLTGKSKGTTRRGFKTLKEAKDAMAKLQVEIIDGEFKNQQLETYRDVYLQWIENYENTVQDSTFLKTLRIFELHILPAMGDYRIEKIDIVTCQKLVNLWSKKLKRFRMVKNYAAKVMTYAMKNGYVSKNPFSLVEIPIVKKTVSLDEEEHENFYTKEELLEFLQCFKNENNFRNYVFFHLLAYTGMRKGELFALTFKDINFDKKEIKINKAIARGKNGLYIGPTKNGLTRVIAIDDKSLELIKEWDFQLREILKERGLKFNSRAQLLFPNLKNTIQDPNKTYGWLNKIISKYNLKPLTTHGLRHTHCSLLFMAGVSVKDVQVRLGHKDVKITLEIYTHVTNKSKTESIDKFQNYLNSSEYAVTRSD